jgi:cell division transport system permease protein
MKSIKNHLALILPLFAILFAVEYLQIIDRVVKMYEDHLKTEYTIIVVTETSVLPGTIQQVSPLIDKVEFVDAEQVLMRIRQQISQESLEKLQSVMPLFYTITLRRYPDQKSLEELRKSLMALHGVKRVQMFEKVHHPLYTMLMFLKANVKVFALFFGVVGFLLILKQMYVWQLEHQERMQIMALFGAPVWLRSGVLFRFAVIDSLIALAMIAGLVFYLQADHRVVALLSDMNIDVTRLVLLQDFVQLAGVALGTALLCAFWVVARFKEES